MCSFLKSCVKHNKIMMLNQIVSARTGAAMKKIFFLQYMMIGLFVLTFGLCLEKLVYFSPSIKWMIYLGGGVLIIMAFTLLDHLYRSALQV